MTIDQHKGNVCMSEETNSKHCHDWTVPEFAMNLFYSVKVIKLIYYRYGVVKGIKIKHDNTPLLGTFL